MENANFPDTGQFWRPVNGCVERTLLIALGREGEVSCIQGRGLQRPWGAPPVTKWVVGGGVCVFVSTAGLMGSGGG